MNMNFNFNNPTNLIFGRGSLNKLGGLPMPGKKALVLISNGKSTRENGYLDRTLEQLEKAGVETALFVLTVLWSSLKKQALKQPCLTRLWKIRSRT